MSLQECLSLTNGSLSVFSLSICPPQELKLVDLFESSTVVSMPASVLAVPSRQKTAEIMYSITNKT